MYQVLITNEVPSELLEPLTDLATVIQGPSGGDLMSRAEVLRLAPTLDAIINQAELRVDRELLEAAPRLQIVANVALGTDNLDLPAMAERGVWATNVQDAFVDSTADCTLGLILGVARRLVEADSYVRAGLWKSFQPGVWDGTTLAGKTLGIVGYGRIGQAVARRARAFGMNIVWCRSSASVDPEYRVLEYLLQESDFISLHLPLTAGTRHLLNAERLALMKKGAVLINMARGKVIDEKALAAALGEGRLGGAGLDVFEFEPEIHPDLLRSGKVILTPHLGGGTREARRAARLLCVRNVAAVLKGEKPSTPVNLPKDRPSK
ncbi:lactate dehydrogenase-like oxidoreductase [Opitutaceae bacterium TAV1]|nr:lactate dehydrogenase-like oxidoreductase [Opitutaceae bacterium TAV1]